MSQAIRNQILSIIDTMENANTVLQQLLANQDLDNSIILLTECQSCAIEVGNKLERIYGENLKTIHALETYCEYVYQLAEIMDQSYKAPEKYQQICRQILLIRKSIEDEIPDKKEIVFLPYKAAMWDSLESIYLAAKEDRECDVYCVPIPYYDKNPDGGFGEMHYEIDEYPPNIDVTNYKDYDLAERRPDAIYIHNPYDNANYVTSVHPDYYCKNLREYTDKLVYIPYFVLGEIEPTNQAAINGMKHFCFLPGTIYAHKVIVQSENMKQIYVNEFIKAAKENGLQGPFIDRKIQEERFLGLGSPKLDKVASANKENLSIPKAWLHIIMKSDGTQKKIIFYNTTIGAFLEHREKMLEKIKDTLDFFYQNQEDVALLWRPHPLMESTIKSMCPGLWPEYNNIVMQYKREDWGIYDDSADLNRAIAFSDCYYGDPSSVVQLYQKTGKPIMIQNVYTLYHA